MARLRCYLACVEHSCHRCGARVEDGNPFCAQCGAPQIRVSVDQFGTPPSDTPEMDAGSPPLPPGTPEDVQPPAEPVVKPQNQLPQPFPAPGFPARPLPAKLVWPTAIRVSLIVGVVTGLVTIVPSITFLTLLMVAAGVVSVRIYRARILRFVSRAEGFRLGALTGVVSSLLKTVISVLQLLVPEGRAEMMKQLDAQLSAAMARNADPAAQEMIKRMADWFRTPDGFATMFMVGLVVVFVFSVLLSGLGGAIGASVFGHKEPGA